VALPLIIYYIHFRAQEDYNNAVQPQLFTFLSLLDYPMAYFSTAMDLPFEIWLHIASFLPTDQLQRMHTLSRMFYGIAMTEKYKVIDFSKDMKTIPGTLASLK
jgi:hypothetical protein